MKLFAERTGIVAARTMDFKEIFQPVLLPPGG